LKVYLLGEPHKSQIIFHLVAQVMEKEASQKRYEEARARNITAGQVRQDSTQPERGMQLFTIDVNLPPNGTAIFTLAYK
jgi:hypothetical protein